MMNTKNIATVAAAMLMAGGMMFAQTGDLPASRGVNESGWAPTVNAMEKLPAATGTLETPNAGSGSNGERPGTGIQNGERGSASSNRNMLPGSSPMGY